MSARTSAASRTRCVFCGRVHAGATCLDVARPEPLSDAAIEVVLAHAADRVRALVRGHGTPVPIAARHVARRMGLDYRDVLRRLDDLRTSPAWWTGDRRRATSRPIAAKEREQA